MCLAIKSLQKPEPKVAKRSITCYKLMVYNNLKNSAPEWRTGYRWFLVADNIVDGTEPMCADGVENIYESFRFPDGAYEYDIRDGFIHTFKKPESAFRIIKNVKEGTLGEWYEKTRDYRVFKCVIPKGVSCFEGEDDSHNKCYASKKIKFVEEITEN